MSLRILHIVRAFHPSVGGLEIFVQALAKQQRKDGLQAEVLTLDRLKRDPKTRLPAREVVDGVPVRRIGYFGSGKYPIALGALKHLDEFDLIHVHAVDFFCDYLALTRPLHGKPLVLSTHGGFFHTSFARRLKTVYFNTVTRLSLTQYDAVVVNSANDQEIFQRIAGARPILIENGVDTERFADTAAWRFTPTLLYIGRFSVNKGLNQMVDAFDRIAAEIPGAKFHIVGNDFDNLYPGLRRRIDGLPHGKDIEVHLGLSDEALREVIKSCSLFVSASEYEGFGQTVVEAMSAGLVPIMNRIKSFEAIAARTQVGLVTDFSDPATAAREAVSFIKGVEPRYDAARSEAIAASQAYSWVGTAKRFADVYDQVLGPRGRAPSCTDPLRLPAQ